MSKHNILLIDDDESLAQVMDYNLREAGYKVRIAASGEAGIKCFKERKFSLVISDIKMPGIDGIEVLRRLKSIDSQVLVIMITAFGSIEKAVEAMKSGAFDYVTKPFNKDEFILTVKKALERFSLGEENRRLKNELGARFQRRQIITAAPNMLKILDMAEKVAASDASVLISGESGTGKELLARFLHYNGDRVDKAFVPINCAAIPKDLLESELFGHVKGAFTGAHKEKRGKFELADEGTIFLDEIAEMPMELQKKLLRVLQEREVEPVGAEKARSVDVRIVSASNQSLEALIARGLFRDDLYYRINVIPLNIPPLRERPEDISLLTRHFIKQAAPERDIKFDKGVMAEFMRYPWRGNVRELENICKRMVLLSENGVISLKDLPWEAPVEVEPGNTSLLFELPDKSLPLEQLEREVIRQALIKHNWNQSKAAKYLHIPRHVLIYRLEKFDLQKSRDNQCLNYRK